MMHVREVQDLNHEAFDDAMEEAAFVTRRQSILPAGNVEMMQ